MTKAYSYLRFSTPEQSKGNSFERQFNMAADYAARNGLELDEKLTFQDLGMSAFRGRNAETGRLGDFLQAISDGQVEQGSYLLVESLDRISRLSARHALRVLESIVDAGVNVVTLNDGRVYDAAALDRDPMALMLALLTFIRGNEESETKARRLKAAWASKRARGEEKPLTARGPAWLALNAPKGRFETIPDRVAVVRRIYKMAATGMGQVSIATTLNAEKVPTFGDGKRKAAFWHKSYVLKILGSEAVIGVMTPHVMKHEGGKKQRIPETDELGNVRKIEGYFPAVIPKGLYDKVQASRKTRAVPQRGGTLNNLLGGLTACPTCGASMTRVMKGSRSKPYLVCSKAKAGAAKHYVAVRQEDVEAALLDNLGSLNDMPSGKDTKALDKEVAGLEGGLSALHSQIENLVDAIARRPSAALTKRLRDLEDTREETVALLEAARQKQTAATPKTIAFRLDELERIAAGTPLDRPAFNAALRRLFSSVVVDHKRGTLDFEWHHGGVTSITYAWPGQGGRKRARK